MISASFKIKVPAFIALAAALFTATTSIEPANAITPEEIKAKGKAVIGVQMDQFPWGFINESGKNEGFDIEIAEMIAKELGVTPEYVRITGQNRIPILVGGMVDFLVPSMTVSEERGKVIQYVIPYSANDVTVWARKDVEVKSNDDLGKVVIGVTRSNLFDTLLVSVAPPNTEIKRYDDDATTVQALLSGQVDAIVGSLTYGLIIEKVGKSDQFERKYKMADNLQSMAVRKGDKEMLDFLNDFVTRHTADGTLDAIYKKWIGVDRAKLPTTFPGVDFTGQ